MRTLLIAVVTLLLSTSVFSQNFYGLTFRKAYTKQEIKDHFWDKEVTFDGNDIDIQIGENEIKLEFGCLYNQCAENTLTRILSFDPSESKASSMYEDAKLLFGKPTGGFEEEKIKSDDLFNGPSVTEKNYVFYYTDKYRKGDALVVTMTVSNSGYSGGKLDKHIVFEIDYNSDASYWQKPESNSSKGDDYLGGLYKGWKIKKQF